MDEKVDLGRTRRSRDLNLELCSFDESREGQGCSACALATSLSTIHKWPVPRRARPARREFISPSVDTYRWIRSQVTFSHDSSSLFHNTDRCIISFSTQESTLNFCPSFGRFFFPSISAWFL